MDKARPLSCYKLRFANPDYPILSFVYAIYAGGENTLYCDHGEDFFNAYLVDAVVEGTRKRASASVEAVRAQGDDAATAAAHVDADNRVDTARRGAEDRRDQVQQIFGQLIAKRAVMTTRDPADQEAVVPGETEVDAILALIRAELLRSDPPSVPPAPWW
jgi:hypothetical protein